MLNHSLCVFAYVLPEVFASAVVSTVGPAVGPRHAAESGRRRAALSCLELNIHIFIFYKWDGPPFTVYAVG